ncbi:MAG TPA: FAD-dependent oxidoreductase [Candidatus Omnitrophota bacterium]|nr:FAD-dependent oxidoreductase [Candidatus Omnitrophota bacterium]
MKIVILGNSPAGVKIIEEIRQHDSSSEITMIAFDGHYPNMRDRYAAFIGKEISPEKVFYRARNFYEQNKVNLVFDKKISRINVKRQRIFTEDKEQIDYDILVVTDTPENRFPDIKGATKEYIFGYKKLKDIDGMVNALPVAKTVVMQSDSFSGLEAAAAFIKREKEVILVCPGENFLARYFDAAAMAWLRARLEEKGLRIMAGNPISEILGDKDAKAVRLSSGKVFGAEIILFAETDEDLRLFSDSGLSLGRKIGTDQNFKAIGTDNLFVVDQASGWTDDADPITLLEVLEEQGRKVAGAICGNEKEFVLPLCARNLTVGDMTVSILGQAQAKDGVVVRQTFIPETGQYKRFCVENGVVIGAVLVNNENEKPEILRKIAEKTLFQWNDEAGQGVVETDGTTCCGAESSTGNVSTELVDK